MTIESTIAYLFDALGSVQSGWYKPCKALLGLIVVLAILSPSVFAQSPGVMMSVDVDNIVVYGFDVLDPAKWGQSPGPTVRLPLPPAFANFIALADVVAVNGKPARGLWLLRQTILTLRPSPTPGQAIADVSRSGVFDSIFELQQEDGTPIGGLMITGINAGDRPPGSPLNFPGANSAIVGGTGAFLGMRGQFSNLSALPGARPIRQASVMEDPANRRTLGGGGNYRVVFHLVPLGRPEITSVFHSDFTPVTVSSPARAGEMLILNATGLGPTRPGVDPGKPFSATPLQEVNSPVDVVANGQAVQIVNKIGWPDTTARYRIDFRLPDGIVPGMATLQISAAFINGPEIQIPVR